MDKLIVATDDQLINSVIQGTSSEADLFLAPAFYAKKDSLPCSQEPVTGSCPQLNAVDILVSHYIKNQFTPRQVPQRP
jgi:hypothetical protein